MKKWGVLALAVLLTGCNAQIADFVRNTDRAQQPSTQPNVAEPKMKISPGYVASAGSTTGGRFNITPTNATMTGTHTGAKLSISQSRME